MAKEIKILYKKAPDFRLLPATGAWGGPAFTGDIVINFYADRVQEPDEITLIVDDKKGSMTEKDRPEPQNVREVLVGIVLRPDIALSIGQFLQEKANLVLKKSDVPKN